MSMDEEKKKLEENKFNENDKRIRTELKVFFIFFSVNIQKNS